MTLTAELRAALHRCVYVHRDEARSVVRIEWRHRDRHTLGLALDDGCTRPVDDVVAEVARVLRVAVERHGAIVATMMGEA